MKIDNFHLVREVHGKKACDLIFIFQCGLWSLEKDGETKISLLHHRVSSFKQKRNICFLKEEKNASRGFSFPRSLHFGRGVNMCCL